MRIIRRSQERGRANHGWLDARHTFSFASFYDPKHMRFRCLRVINEDRVAAGAGFGTHPHEDMEIITWVLEGGIRHRDSMGNGAVLRPGDVQAMSAGTGITHSEFNASPSEPLRLLQIWIEPDREGIAPRYRDQTIPSADRRNRLHTIVTPDGRDGTLPIQQHATIAVADLDAGAVVEHAFAPGRHGWIQVAKGGISVDGQALAQGDAMALSEEAAAVIAGVAADSQILLFDLP